jgi:hypothetical protein
MNGYKLIKEWFEFAINNPELIRPAHTAMYCYAVEHCNKLGWVDKFGLPTDYTMAVLGIKKRHTFIKYFNELVEWGFFSLIEASKNQYTSNIISLNATSKNRKVNESENDLNQQKEQKSNKTDESTAGKPTISEIEKYFFEKITNPKKEAEMFYAYNNATDWKIRGQTVKNWQSLADLWLISEERYKKKMNQDYSDEILNDPRLSPYVNANY